jgi:hypothetical protein
VPRVTLGQCQAWAEKSKLTLTSLDEELLDQIETEVLAQIGVTYNTSTWIDTLTTPKLVQIAISKKYVVWVYERQYSENVPEGGSAYAQRLDANAEMLITGIVDGTIELPGLELGTGGQPSFYPNDSSSALEPTVDDRSLGPAKFSMGQVF